MAFELRSAGEPDREAWEKAVEASPHGTIFHSWRWLKTLERHVDMRLYPLLAYQGSQLVALYPFFVHTYGPFRVADSPASDGFMLYLGPVIPGYEQMKQERREHVFLSLQEKVDDFLISELGCKLIRVRTSPSLPDSRPLIWRQYRVKPAYTYRIDLAGGIDRVWEQFDGKLKADIRRSQKMGVTVREGGPADLLEAHDTLYRRFREKGLKKRECREFLADIYREFQPSVKVFVAEYQGKVVGSVVALLHKDILRFWFGTPKSGLKGIYPNNLVQWEGIRWAAANGLRICENMDTGDDVTRAPFKAKFNAGIELWFKADKYASNFYKLGHFFINPDQF
ncbi:MAG TPA: GNAT family N-acetyltransferase [Methanomicrobiales archaeon]|jgi:lipid II:glycine glycyltransferase (peptidoglycan interpeptide bridge formation enzyme)|nr:GNAT family N-acetyltransferase [Methanomicrobiales archaeon]